MHIRIALKRREDSTFVICVRARQVNMCVCLPIRCRYTYKRRYTRVYIQANKMFDFQWNGESQMQGFYKKYLNKKTDSYNLFCLQNAFLLSLSKFFFGNCSQHSFSYCLFTQSSKHLTFNQK